MSDSSLKTSAAIAAPALMPMSAGLVVLMLSMLLGLQTITTDLYLPALPALTESFAASMGQAQLTLTAMLLAFGLSQLVWGPLSDRFGRRPILLLGLAAYVLAAVASAMAASMDMLIACRVLQGAAMGAAVMGARAIVRDLYEPVDGTRIISKGLTGLGILACLSGPVGGLLSDNFGSRTTLLALAIFGAFTLALVALRFEETVTQKNLLALRPLTLISTWWKILRNPTFLTYSALTTTTYAGLFTYLAASPFVFIKVLGLTKTQYGFVMFSMPMSYIAGTFVCRLLLPRLGIQRTVAIGGAFSLAGGTLMGGLAMAGLSSGWAIMLPFYLFMLAHGIHQPCGQSAAIGPFPQAAGAASALNGFLMMLASFAMGGWLGTHMDGTVGPLAYGVWFWGALTALIAWTVVQKHGKASAH
jgi:DHA1 family bicyclomycin/chloramphenicol resistance-like MFS transporter